MSDLIGKTVREVFVSVDQDRLVVVYDGGVAFYRCWQECCSETWIADLCGVSSLIGHTVLAAEDMDLPNIDDDRSRQVFDQFYGIKLTTTGGYVDIIYRNSSNGYYGGDLARDEQLKDSDELELIAITEDYSA